ncbi:cation:proton antiporter [Pedobacter frigiditerrae]|uniref:cation:proton antiporter domain-containing protein n=1 Tax=Pedobacter frigiditerrae TaxID=2530452 RepID=UPI003977AF30
MTLPLIITICALILIAYVFDITSRHTKVPTVIFLLVIGWVLKQLIAVFDLQVVNLMPLLPIFGTLGLILIVLEGGLELEVNKQKKPLIKKAVLSALFPLIALATILSVSLHFFTGAKLIDCLINVVPFCVISSAIAIPSVQNLGRAKKEQVIYESSMSDIIGVVLFDFLINNEVINLGSFVHFGIELAIMLVVSLIASIGLAFLIKKIEHHVKLVPIMMMIVLIYAVAKAYHLPALLFILIFGLFLNNLDEFKQFSFIRYLKPKILDVEIHRFTRLVGEAAFLIRTIFFILFGYSIDINDLFDLQALPYSIGIFVCVLLVRLVQLKITKEKLLPMLFIAPRGLITIMLFLSIPIGAKLTLVNEPMVLQLIILSILVMMTGLVVNKEGKEIN